MTAVFIGASIATMKAFCEAERRRIDARLRERGRNLFLRYGIRRTRVQELAAAAGIAAGSFYSFYPSKEALYLALALEEWEGLRPRIEELCESRGNPRRLLSGLIAWLMEAMKRSAFMELPFSAEADAKKACGSETGEFERLRRASLFGCARLVQSWQARGAIRQGDPEAISALIVSFAYLGAFRGAIGPEAYSALERLIPAALAEGLASAEPPLA